MNKRLLAYVIAVFSLFVSPAVLLADSQVISANARIGLDLTVYGNALALIRDRRNLLETNSSGQLTFEAISPQSIGTSFRISGPDGLQVIEKSFIPASLSLSTLLESSIGKKVGIRMRKRPGTTENGIKYGTLLATNGGALVQTSRGIETVKPARLVFDRLPEKLTPVARFHARTRGQYTSPAQVTLSYLSSGISWRSDYSLVIDPDFTAGKLESWATIQNSTGVAFENTHLKLVAGTVNTRERARPQPKVMMSAARLSMDAASEVVVSARESLGNFHLYTIKTPVDLASGQTVQLPLIPMSRVALKRTLISRGTIHFYGRQNAVPQAQSHPTIELLMVNRQPSGPGKPMAAGLVRLFTQDSSGTEQFAGEDRINDVPVGGTVKLTTGQAFDLTVERVRTAYSRNNQPRNAFEETWQISVINGSNTAQQVLIAEPFPGEWEIREETVPHQKTNGEARWQLSVPAKGKAMLSYKVRVRR